MKFLFVLGRIPELSYAELEALFASKNVERISDSIAIVTADSPDQINFARIGGSLKCGRILEEKLPDYLASLPEGKITLGFSDYSPQATRKGTWNMAMKYKNLLIRHGRSVRLVPCKEQSTISSAAALHNHLGNRQNHIEIIKYRDIISTSIACQNIDAYTRRDRARPARDAFVGMLPPKLAQILINLATGNPETGIDPRPARETTLLDPFCGTGVVLQEALMDNYNVYGTDLADKMIEYSRRNLDWLIASTPRLQKETAGKFQLEPGDATKHSWQLAPVDFVASEIYLGHPLSNPPGNAKLLQLQQEAKALFSSFLKNLAPQLKPGAGIALAIPAWLRANGEYKGIEPLDEICNLPYNVTKYKYAASSNLLYNRENQVVARQIIVLRKK